MSTIRISIGGDHAGYDLKEKVKLHLASRGITSVNDHGPHSGDSVDYPDFVHPVCRDVIEGAADLAILICGSGNGVAMTANKYTGSYPYPLGSDLRSLLLRSIFAFQFY